MFDFSLKEKKQKMLRLSCLLSTSIALKTVRRGRPALVWIRFFAFFYSISTRPPVSFAASKLGLFWATVRRKNRRDPMRLNNEKCSVKRSRRGAAGWDWPTAAQSVQTLQDVRPTYGQRVAVCARPHVHDLRHVD